MPQFSRIAGDAVLDLVNTVEWRLDDETRIEDLRSYHDVLDWCLQAGFVTASEKKALAVAAGDDIAAAERQRASVIALREALYRALFDDDAEAAQHLTEAHRRSLRRASLAPSDSGWEWRDAELTVRTPIDRIARAVPSLLARPDLDRLHQCEDARCGWVYLDTSPRRNRRWCVASDCGDRNRARAYYARKTGRVDAG